MIALAGIGIGIGTAGGAALEGIARQPEVTSTIQQTLLLLVVLPELFLAFLAFVVAIIIIQTIRNCRC
ncbi:hypothetical protein BFG57_08085 [Bacillus solimangrovi]|uniref:V-ATPase proteolipid subunit C-like domain-containing protein n=2 Tax=Bacillus solimangrovi TaxID=1305675 RepID=A0A1E5LKB7_9BACI|nr:hypothetical protein BFG57_08085 [Bacillus solimangrovi]